MSEVVASCTADAVSARWSIVGAELAIHVMRLGWIRVSASVYQPAEPIAMSEAKVGWRLRWW
jgi:hypothetical protein